MIVQTEFDRLIAMGYPHSPEPGSEQYEQLRQMFMMGCMFVGSEDDPAVIAQMMDEVIEFGLIHFTQKGAAVN